MWSVITIIHHFSDTYNDLAKAGNKCNDSNNLAKAQHSALHQHVSMVTPEQ